jgi:farnesyl-diphosphate farnesyltransferase
MQELTPRQLLRMLREVSRSFYLSIRLLPRRLAEPVGLAYLLARATDTLADTASVPAGERAMTLAQLAAAIQGGDSGNAAAELSRSFAPRQSDEAERRLIESVPEILRILDVMNPADRGDIRALLVHITRGQKNDVERFAAAGGVVALQNAQELQQYTYDVAGAVGEFWTRLCFRYIDDFAEESETRMNELGRRYGEGLQLVNILRDTSGDLQNGRCYFPADELEEAGLSPGEIAQAPERFLPIYHRWLEQAESGLKAGMEYVRAINHFRVRAATALPALIGARTLSMIRSAGPNALRERIKVPRKEVRSTIATVALTLARRQQLEEMFQRRLL